MCRIRLFVAIMWLTLMAGRWPVGYSIHLNASDECPRISVTCPTTLVRQGELLTLTASTSGGASKAPYTFNWTISAGTITSGQGTSSIGLDTTGLAGQNVEVTVEVGGFREQCAKSASCVVSVSAPPREPHSFDQYGDIKFNDEKARLDNFAIQLGFESETIGYIVIYDGKRVSLHEVRNRARRAKSYVVNRRGIEARRIRTVYGGKGYGFSTELWIIPNGVGDPKFGQVIK